ncbi:hypothetical protein [Devosia sp. CN2-171]|uniref:hypothetical protein n=1 Tax=Devosia sp. CN2-171 TaxID=3400909 RepID=UPI003BF92883
MVRNTSWTVPEVRDPLGDALIAFDTARAGARGERYENEARDTLAKYVESLYGTDPAVRAGAATNPGQGEIRPTSPGGRTGVPSSLDQLISGSHDAAELARDPRTSAALEARYGQQPRAPKRVASADPNDPAMSYYIASTRAAESGGDPNARNPNSSAEGPYQFLDDTWSGLMHQYPDLGLTPDGRTDPAQSEKAMRAFTNDNIRALRSAGIPVNPTSLYSAHFLGAGGASKVLSAPSNAPMTALVSPEVIEANPQLVDMTQGDFVQWASTKGGGATGGYRAPRAGTDGSFAGPVRQVPLPPKEVLMALVQNPATREFGASLIQQAQKGSTTTDQFQTFSSPDGTLAQVNMSTGEVKLLRDGAKTDSWRTVTDPNERAQMGIPADDKGVYQVDQTGQVKAVGGGGVNVSIGGEKAYDQKLNQNLAETFIATQDGSNNALRTITTLDAMTAALDDPKFYSGFGSEPALAVKRLVATMGLDPAAATSMEQFNALAKQSALDLMGGSLGAGFSNADRSFVVEQTADLSATEEGNRALIAMQRKLAQRQIEIGKVAAQYAAQHDGRLDSNWASYLADWAEANPLFPQQLNVGRGAGAAPATGGGGTLPDPMGIR